MSVQKSTRGRPRSVVPGYRLHRRSGQAVVTVQGRDIYLGRHGSDGSKRKYGEIIGRLANGLSVEPDRQQAPAVSSVPTVDEVCSAFVDFAQQHYVKRGKPTSEVALIYRAIQPLHELYGDVPADQFGPRLLKAYRDNLIARDWCRNTCNAMVSRVCRIFRHAVAEELIPPECYQRLAAVTGLRAGRSAARESEPVRPVDDADVEAVLPHVTPIVADMIRVQRATGMRPGELCGMTWAEIDTTGEVWLYSPSDHKLAHHGRDRSIAIGPRAQEILKRRRGLDLTGPVFAGRGGCFTTAAYRRAITRGCELAFGMPDDLSADEQAEWRDAHSWHPNRLRHSFATELRRTPGTSLDTIAAVLGHTQLRTSQVYAEMDLTTASDAVRRIG